MATFLNRVTLMGYIELDPQIVGHNTSHEIVILQLVTAGSSYGNPMDSRYRSLHHRVVVTDYTARQYAYMFLQKRHSVLVEGYLEYSFDGSSGADKAIRAEVVVSGTGCTLRRLDEPKVTEFASASATSALQMSNKESDCFHGHKLLCL